MKQLCLHFTCWLLLGFHVCAANPLPKLFFTSPSDEGKVAIFSKKALFDRNDGDKIRYGDPFEFEADAVKVWADDDGERVLFYVVGIAGTLKTDNLRVNVLLDRGGVAYLGQAGNVADEPNPLRGIGKLYLEPGQSYITFQIKDKDEAIKVAHDLASLLK